MNRHGNKFWSSLRMQQQSLEGSWIKSAAGLVGEGIHAAAALKHSKSNPQRLGVSQEQRAQQFCSAPSHLADRVYPAEVSLASLLDVQNARFSIRPHHVTACYFVRFI